MTFVSIGVKAVLEGNRFLTRRADLEEEDTKEMRKRDTPARIQITMRLRSKG
jgi:hypothetical protein